MVRDRLLFAKEGRARFISHLDLMRTFQRAFLRADIPIKHTEGFNPHPFVSIALPLSVGFSSGCEILETGLPEDYDRESVPERMNAVLPEGIRVLSCYSRGRPIKELALLDYEIGIECADPAGLKAAWSALLERESWVVEKPSKKAKSGAVTIDLAALVKGYRFSDAPGGVLLTARLSAQNPGLNPQVLTAALTAEVPDFPPDALSYRRLEVLDSGGGIFR